MSYNGNRYNSYGNSHNNGNGYNHENNYNSNIDSGSNQQPRKTGHRRTIDSGSQMAKYIIQRGLYSQLDPKLGSVRPELSHLVELLPPKLYNSKPIINEHTKFVHLSANKAKHQIHAMKWTPFGRRLLVASHSGEFTLWNGSTFNFESIMQAHDSAIYSLQYSHNDDWLISGDQDGTIKYWQPNFNNVNILTLVHTGSITDLCFSPNDSKFVSSSDDHFLKIWNFNNGKQELTLSGHHWDVKSCDWHPSLGLIVSGSKDNMVSFWDPRLSSGGRPITTIRSFKHTVQCTKFQRIGNQRLFAAAAKDKSAKIFDIRQMKDVLVLRNDQCDFATLTWHPTDSQTLTLSDFNGKIDHVILDKCTVPDDGTSEIPYTSFNIPYAHEKLINQVEYNPMGNILASASSDKTIRFWARSRPGDPNLFKEATYTNDKNGAWYYSAANIADATNVAATSASDVAAFATAAANVGSLNGANSTLNDNDKNESSDLPPPPPPPMPPPPSALAGSQQLPRITQTNGNNNVQLPGF